MIRRRAFLLPTLAGLALAACSGTTRHAAETTTPPATVAVTTTPPTTTEALPVVSGGEPVPDDVAANDATPDTFSPSELDTASDTEGGSWRTSAFPKGVATELLDVAGRLSHATDAAGATYAVAWFPNGDIATGLKLAAAKLGWAGGGADGRVDDVEYYTEWSANDQDFVAEAFVSDDGARMVIVMFGVPAGESAERGFQFAAAVELGAGFSRAEAYRVF